MKREDFKKKIVRKDGGFVFQSEWWNIIKNKRDDYKAWFFDVVMAFHILLYAKRHEKGYGTCHRCSLYRNMLW